MRGILDLEGVTMSDQPVLEAPAEIAGEEPIVVRPARRIRLRIIAIVVGGLVVLGAAFGGGVLVGSHIHSGGPTQGQFGSGGPGGFGGFGGAPGSGTQGGTGQGGSGQSGSGQGGSGQGGTGNGGTGA
jgi:hypothetical protein